MSKKSGDQASVYPDQVKVQGAAMDVWPEQQRIEASSESSVPITDFADSDRYHRPLVEKILNLEKDPRYVDMLFKGGCGTKVRSIEDWPFATARLIHARAMRLCSEVLGREQQASDVTCLISVYWKMEAVEM